MSLQSLVTLVLQYNFILTSAEPGIVWLISMCPVFFIFKFLSSRFSF